MSDRIDIRIDTQRDRRHLAERRSNPRDFAYFGLGFTVETVDARFKCIPDLRFRFSDAGKHDRTGIGSGRKNPIEFTAGDDVESGSFLCQRCQDRKIRIGLYRETNSVLQAFERLRDSAESGKRLPVLE